MLITAVGGEVVGRGWSIYSPSVDPSVRMFMNVPGAEGSEGLPPRTALSVLNLAILLVVLPRGIAVPVS